MPPQTATLELPASLRHAALVRCLGENVFASAGFSKPWQGRLKLVLDELFMNAVGYGSAPEGKVKLRFEWDDREVRCTVEDEGRGKTSITPQALQALVEAKAKSTGPENTSGRGLAVIAQGWTNGFGIKKSPLGGLAVSFSKTIETGTPPSAAAAPLAMPQGPVVSIAFPATGEAYDAGDAFQSLQAKAETLAAGSALSVDLHGVTYINSQFVGRLVELHNRLKAKSCALALSRVRPEVRDVLELVGLQHILIFAS